MLSLKLFFLLRFDEKNCLQPDLNPGLLACLAEALPLDQGLKWNLTEKRYWDIDLFDSKI